MPRSYSKPPLGRIWLRFGRRLDNKKEATFRQPLLFVAGAGLDRQPGRTSDLWVMDKDNKKEAAFRQPLLFVAGAGLEPATFGL